MRALFSPSVRGRAAEGGRGSLTRHLELKLGKAVLFTRCSRAALATQNSYPNDDGSNRLDRYVCMAPGREQILCHEAHRCYLFTRLWCDKDVGLLDWHCEKSAKRMPFANERKLYGSLTAW